MHLFLLPLKVRHDLCRLRLSGSAPTFVEHNKLKPVRLSLSVGNKRYSYT